MKKYFLIGSAALFASVAVAASVLNTDKPAAKKQTHCTLKSAAAGTAATDKSTCPAMTKKECSKAVPECAVQQKRECSRSL